MKAILRKIILPVGIVWFLALLVAGFLGYCVTSSGPDGVVDGLGRNLTEAPFLMRIFFGQDRLWPGFGWFVLEMVAFWGSIAATSFLSKWLED